ncbi:hypothetical protein MRX96_024146 [Rhipicephalus microplus]
MDRLRCSSGIVRAAATRLVMSTMEALQVVNLSPVDPQVVLDDLQDKSTTLAGFNEKIDDLIIGAAEYGEELTAALQYHDKIRDMISCVRHRLNSASRSLVCDTACDELSLENVNL